MKTRIHTNTLRKMGLIALFSVSLACFAYINTVDVHSGAKIQESTFVEELTPDSPEVLPDVQLIRKIVRAAFEFMSKTMS